MKEKLPAAVELGRRGGLARARQLSKKKRQEIAQNAINSRWQKANKQGIGAPGSIEEVRNGNE